MARFPFVLRVTLDHTYGIEIPDLSASEPEVPLHAQDAIVASMGRSQSAPTL